MIKYEFFSNTDVKKLAVEVTTLINECGYDEGNIIQDAMRFCDGVYIFWMLLEDD